MGLISTGLWDLLFKPGLTHVGRVFLTVITLGSETMRDGAYASAALDPTPLPSLMLLLLFFWGGTIMDRGCTPRRLGRLFLCKEATPQDRRRINKWQKGEGVLEN